MMEIFLFLLIEVFIKIITDSYVIIRDNTERSHVHYTLFTPVITFAKLWYHNEDIDIHTVHLFVFRFNQCSWYSFDDGDCQVKVYVSKPAEFHCCLKMESWMDDK